MSEEKSTLEKVLGTARSVLGVLIPGLKNPDSTHGIKETKEAFIGVNEVALLLIHRFRDGVGVDDALAIWNKVRNDQEFKDKIMAAYENYSKIPAEVSDLDAGEGLELADCAVSYVPKYVDLFKKSDSADAS